ncbi:MAG: hypothetical protein J6B87_02990 [Clostridia bacterium]|nr:hypothetical protein [Clostridia bacterium]
MEEDIEILLDFIKYIRFNEEKHYTIDKYYTAIENSVEHMRKLINKNKELEKERDGIYADYQEIGKDLLKAHEKNEEQEKIIELMAEYIDFDKIELNCSSLCVKDNCREQCIIEYFKMKAKGE